MSQQNSKSAIVSANGCGCLVLLMGIGVIGAIALPSFLNASNKPMISEAKQYVGSMNRAQQALFIEKSAFATSVDALGIEIKTETTNYKYSVRATKQTAFNYGLSKKPELKSYVGGVFVIRVKSNNGEDEMRTESILCSADKPGTIPPLPPQVHNGKLVCGTGTTKVTK
ncbi:MULTISPECIES: type IV pilin-like G/H family protein [unclassified Microcoleus]|uniref:type IV pilin-like G/H family protein n=1 Tax=unclassified Microcoleus TaxID=2642155 RepID=UPI002FD34BCC